MKKYCVLSVLIVLGTSLGFSQDITQAGAPVAQDIGVDTAQQNLKEVSVSKFEDAAFWNVSLPLDSGLTTLRRFEGSPAEKTPLPDEETIGINEPDRYVLGLKAEFFRRGAATISVAPVRPIAVEGIAKTLSVWVVGRNYNHILKVLIEDINGKRQELTIGKLNFSGWKRLTVAVPPAVEQRNPHYNNRQGIKILGFVIDCDLMETYGSFYFYMDDLRAVTDLFSESTRDVDDMLDTW